MPAAVLLAACAVAGLVASRHVAMQYILPPSNLPSHFTGRRVTERHADLREHNTVQRRCAPVESPDSVYWGKFGMREVVPSIAILVTLVLFATTFDLTQTDAKTSRVMHSIPLTGATEGVRKAIDSITPVHAQRVREQQQALVTGTALTVPFAVASLTSTGAIPRAEDP